MSQQYTWWGLDKIQYLLERLKALFYTKDEVDEKLKWNCRAYYYDAATWAAIDPILQPGEIGIDSTNGFMKIGDGIHKWSELDYAIFPVSLTQRSDNLLLKDFNDNLFLGEQRMRSLILEVIMEYHDDTKDTNDFVTDDEYYFITADNLQFTPKSRRISNT